MTGRHRIEIEFDSRLDIAQALFDAIFDLVENADLGNANTIDVSMTPVVPTT